MKKTFFFALLTMVSAFVMAGENDLLWDYTTAKPAANAVNGWYYGSCLDDGTSNFGLKGIKLNISGYAYFDKAPVAGKL